MFCVQHPAFWTLLSALFLSPIATPYGGSVNTISASSPSISFFTSSWLELSPHISRCFPSCQISPFFTLHSIESFSSSKSSSSLGCSSSLASSSQFGTSTPQSVNCWLSHSLASASQSQSPKPLLSSMMYAFSCSAVACGGMILHGICV